MKPIRTITLLVVLLSGVAFGCQRETPNELPQGTVPLLVDNPTIALGNESDPAAAASKVTRTGFDAGDSIAFYAVQYTGTTPNILAADNNTYIKHELYIKRLSDLLFASWNGVGYQNKYFPYNGDAIDIYALHPYRITPPTNYSLYNFPVYANQAGSNRWNYNQSDLMTAKTPAIKPTAVPCKLVFHHLLSRVTININLINFPVASTVTAVQILNLNTHTLFDLLAYDPTSGIAGAMISSSTPTNVTPFKEPTPAVGFGYTYAAIVSPQTLALGKNLAEITVFDGSKESRYNVTLKAALTLESGKEHLFSLTIDRGSRPDIGVAPVITAWGSTAPGSGEALKSTEHRFVTSLSNIGAVMIHQATMVKVGVNGKQTFTLPATYSATGGVGGVPALIWEFRGVGNRPIDYPFEVRTLDFLTPGGVSLGGIHTATPAVTITKADASETISLGLNLDMTAHTFSR